MVLQLRNVFLLCYGTGVIYLVQSSYQFCKRSTGNAQLLFWVAMVSYASGFLLWLVDRNHCASIWRGVQKLKQCWQPQGNRTVFWTDRKDMEITFNKKLCQKSFRLDCLDYLMLQPGGFISTLFGTLVQIWVLSQLCFCGFGSDLNTWDKKQSWEARQCSLGGWHWKETTNFSTVESPHQCRQREDGNGEAHH